MAVTSGFFDSNGGDRKYNALQMSSIFDGIIRDGVYGMYGEALAVKAQSGLNITVGTGRAWFDHTWTLNDATLNLTLSASEAILNRYDAVVLEVNTATGVRANTIKVVKGTAASSPAKPTLVATGGVRQYPLAYIYRKGGGTSITQANIENRIGTAECPYVTAPLETISVDQQLAQWGSQFQNWFTSLDVVLQEDVAASLALRLLTIEEWKGAAPPADPSLKRQAFWETNLGPLTSEHVAAIKNGSFKGLHLGAYWTIGGRAWTIVDFNYWINIADGNNAKPHVVVVPRNVLYSSKMQVNRANGVGYVNSLGYTTMDSQALPIIRSAFPDLVLRHTSFLTNNASVTGVFTGAVVERHVDLMSEMQVLGANNFDTPHPTMDLGQFALFRVNPRSIWSAEAYWLSATRGNGRFAISLAGGAGVSVEWADANSGIRPSFAIG